MNEPIGVMMYLSYLDQFELLEDAQIGKLTLALLTYAKNGEYPSFEDPALTMAFSFMAQQFYRDEQKRAAIRDKRSEAGARGGRPQKANAFSEKQKKQMVFSESKKSNDNDNDNDNDKDNGIKDIDQKSDPMFDQFWSAYPKKIAKGKAQTVFAALIKKGVAPGDIVSGAQAYADWCARNGQEPQYIAHPTTWLNGGRWTDELVDKPNGKPPDKPYKTIAHEYDSIYDGILKVGAAE